MRELEEVLNSLPVRLLREIQGSCPEGGCRLWNGHEGPCRLGQSRRAEAEIEYLEKQGTPEAVLTIHQRRDLGSCFCGWSELGRSFAAHQADELRRAGLLAA